MPDLPAPTPILVYGLPPLWGTPSPSPFVIKLLTWLRMAGLPHELRVLTRPAQSPTGKIPYVLLPDGSMLHDSELVIEELSRRHGIDLDAGLSPEQRALSHVLRRMIEEHTYWGGVFERWITNEGYAATAHDYFAHMPAAVRWIVPLTLRPKMRRYLFGQGLGRHPQAVIERKISADVEAISAMLGERDHLHGRPTSIDATMYGFILAFSAHPFPSAIKRAVESRPNLLAYRERMNRLLGGG
jgi:glutathione S-transferase